MRVFPRDHASKWDRRRCKGISYRQYKVRRAPEVATAGERLVGLNDSGETTAPESGSDCPVASFVDDSIPLGSSSSHDT